MPKITNFAFCEKTNIEGNLPQVINLMQVIETSSDSFSFSIMYSITGFTSNENHNGYVLLSGPNNEMLVETDRFVFDAEENSGIPEGNLMTGITMGVEFGNVQFKGTGLYKIDLFFDDELLGDFYVPVTFEREGDE